MQLPLNLPFQMMAEARRDRGPVRAAVTAQVAVAIAILTIVPVRIKNLTQIGWVLISANPEDQGRTMG
jgi:hypothetical protein